MKHVLRKPRAGRLRAGAAGRAAGAREDRAPRQRSTRASVPLAFGPGGAAETEWTIPKQAKLGSYEIQLVPQGGQDWDAQTTGTFRVEEFRVPLDDGRASSRRAPRWSARPSSRSTSPCSTSRAAARVAARHVRTQMRERAVVGFPDYAGLLVRDRRRRGGHAHAALRRATRRAARPHRPRRRSHARRRAAPAARTWRSARCRRRARARCRSSSSSATRTARCRPLAHGADLAGVARGRPAPRERALAARRDPPRGRGRRHGRQADLARGRRRSRPSDDELLAAQARRRRLLRLRGRRRVVKLGTFCSGRTDARGPLRVRGAAARPRRPRLRRAQRRLARARERGARPPSRSPATTAWFAQGDGDRMDLVPDQPRYEPGESARFQVRMPFREATALVTVEREGVAERFVTKLSSADDPVVSVPIAREPRAERLRLGARGARARGRAAPPTATRRPRQARLPARHRRGAASAGARTSSRCA